MRSALIAVSLSPVSSGQNGSNAINFYRKYSVCYQGFSYESNRIHESKNIQSTIGSPYLRSHRDTIVRCAIAGRSDFSVFPLHKARVFKWPGDFLWAGSLDQLTDENEDSGVLLRGWGTNDPTDPIKHTITFQLGADFMLSGIWYLGDEHRPDGQWWGLEDYTLEFYDDDISQGTFASSLAVDDQWQRHLFNNPVIADTVVMRLDSAYFWGTQHGVRAREVLFETSAIPEPSSVATIFGLGLLLLAGGRRSRRNLENN